SSRRRHTRFSRDWSSDVCSSDLFKVFAAGKGTPERWVVRRASGSEIVFTSLRDLQRGITERRVGPEDMLSRGSEPPRQLGLIAELEPFFAARKPALRAGAAGTLLGMAPPVAPAEESAPAPIEDPRSSGTEPVRSATSGTEPVAERRSDRSEERRVGEKRRYEE